MDKHEVSLTELSVRAGLSAGLLRSLVKFPERLTPHVLRHSFAKNLIDAGVGLEKVAALLGHSNLNTTRIYVTPSQKGSGAGSGAAGRELTAA